VLLLGIAFLGTAASPLGLWSSHLERLSHFRFAWIVLLLLLAAFFLKRGRRLPAIASGILLAGSVVTILPYWIPPPKPVREDRGLKFIAWNLLWENPTKDEALPWLLEQNADVLVLTECTHDWRARLEEWSAVYPHRITSGRDGAEGMWLLSRHPLDAPDPAGLAANKPWISTVMHAPQGPLRILGMHPRTPRSGHRFDERNGQYEKAAAISAASDIPVVLLGDLNCTPFSPWFGRLLRDGQLHDTGKGFGLPSTWRSNGIGLPIDHILIRGPWQVLDRKVHPDRMGSDHHPVIAVLGIDAAPHRLTPSAGSSSARRSGGCGRPRPCTPRC
jgi:endonuclease/exonuclease/phosphatase (EEP) superfamily protein YafD